MMMNNVIICITLFTLVCIVGGDEVEYKRIFDATPLLMNNGGVKNNMLVEIQSVSLPPKNKTLAQQNLEYMVKKKLYEKQKNIRVAEERQKVYYIAWQKSVEDARQAKKHKSRSNQTSSSPLGKRPPEKHDNRSGVLAQELLSNSGDPSRSLSAAASSRLSQLLTNVAHLNVKGPVTGRLKNLDKHGVARRELVKFVDVVTQPTASVNPLSVVPELTDVDGRPFQRTVPASMLTQPPPVQGNRYDQDPGNTIRWVPYSTLHELEKKRKQLEKNKDAHDFYHKNDLDFMNFDISPYVRILAPYKDGPNFNLNNALNHPQKLEQRLLHDPRYNKASAEEKQDYALHKAYYDALPFQWPRLVADGMMKGRSANRSRWSGSRRILTGRENWQKLFALDHRPSYFTKLRSPHAQRRVIVLAKTGNNTRSSGLRFRQQQRRRNKVENNDGDERVVVDLEDADLLSRVLKKLDQKHGIKENGVHLDSDNDHDYNDDGDDEEEEDEEDEDEQQQDEPFASNNDADTADVDDEGAIRRQMESVKRKKRETLLKVKHTQLMMERSKWRQLHERLRRQAQAA